MAEGAAKADGKAKGRQSVLDVGPSTVLGERPSLVDPVVLQLGQILEKNLKRFEDGNVELEVRLGIIGPPKQQKSGPDGMNAASTGTVQSTVDAMLEGGRMQLPISTEAVLVPGMKGFQHSWVSGLPPEIFKELSDRLDWLSSEGTPRDQYVECGRTADHSVSTLYKADLSHIDPKYTGLTQVRRTVPVDGGEPLSVVKSMFGHLDIYSGRRPGELGPACDLRASLSTECIVKAFEPAPHHERCFKREKVRKTYHFRAWRLDMTTVLQSFPVTALPTDATRPGAAPATEVEWKPPTQSYEVELELDVYHLKRNLAAKAAGQKHMLWELLSDFLFTARDLAALACEVRPFARPPELGAVPAPVDSEAREDFRRAYGGKDEPLIGHYLYRIAAQQEQLKRQQREELLRREQQMMVPVSQELATEPVTEAADSGFAAVEPGTKRARAG